MVTSGKYNALTAIVVGTLALDVEGSFLRSATRAATGAAGNALTRAPLARVPFRGSVSRAGGGDDDRNNDAKLPTPGDVPSTDASSAHPKDHMLERGVEPKFPFDKETLKNWHVSVTATDLFLVRRRDQNKPKPLPLAFSGSVHGVKDNRGRTWYPTAFKPPKGTKRDFSSYPFIPFTAEDALVTPHGARCMLTNKILDQPEGTASPVDSKVCGFSGQFLDESSTSTALTPAGSTSSALVPTAINPARSARAASTDCAFSACPKPNDEKADVVVVNEQGDAIVTKTSPRIIVDENGIAAVTSAYTVPLGGNGPDSVQRDHNMGVPHATDCAFSASPQSPKFYKDEETAIAAAQARADAATHGPTRQHYPDDASGHGHSRSVFPPNSNTQSRDQSPYEWDSKPLDNMGRKDVKRAHQHKDGDDAPDGMNSRARNRKFLDKFYDEALAAWRNKMEEHDFLEQGESKLPGGWARHYQDNGPRVSRRRADEPFPEISNFKSSGHSGQRKTLLKSKYAGSTRVSSNSHPDFTKRDYSTSAGDDPRSTSAAENTKMDGIVFCNSCINSNASMSIFDFILIWLIQSPKFKKLF